MHGMRLLPLLLLCLFAACQTPPKGITDAQQAHFQKLRRKWEPINREYIEFTDGMAKTCSAQGQVLALVDDDAKCVDKPTEKPKEEKKK